MNNNELQVNPLLELAVETSVFTNYLNRLGLPTDNVIASSKERELIIANIPLFVATLDPDVKREAQYLSKFIGATAIGLFDAALNYVWNEVVLNLRNKVIIYGLDLFYNAAVGGKVREHYKTENDLPSIKDSVLLDTCRKLELISEVVYKKLDYILTMRNEVAASHPNVESIGAFELLGWLQTCVKDVLQDHPSASAIRIRGLIDNVKSQKAVIDEVTVNRFNSELKNLSLPHLHNLLHTLFGIFVAPETDQILKKNIAQLAPSLWQHAEDNVKYKIGITIDGYRTNLNNDKLRLGKEFLTLVNGLEFESLPAKVVAIDTLCDALLESHYERDNYYHEPIHITEILKYCKSSNDIPKEILQKLTSVIITCRLGRGLTYCNGVSPAGGPLYDQLLGLLDDDGIVCCIKAFYQDNINSKLQNSICQLHLKSILTILRNITLSERLKNALDLLLADIPNVYCYIKKREFITLTSPFIVRK